VAGCYEPQTSKHSFCHSRAHTHSQSVSQSVSQWHVCSHATRNEKRQRVRAHCSHLALFFSRLGACAPHSSMCACVLLFHLRSCLSSHAHKCNHLAHREHMVGRPSGCGKRLPAIEGAYLFATQAMEKRVHAHSSHTWPCTPGHAYVHAMLTYPIIGAQPVFTAFIQNKLVIGSDLTATPAHVRRQL
jgi:hypothetical protein